MCKCLYRAKVKYKPAIQVWRLIKFKDTILQFILCWSKSSYQIAKILSFISMRWHVNEQNAPGYLSCFVNLHLFDWPKQRVARWHLITLYCSLSRVNTKANKFCFVLFFTAAAVLLLGLAGNKGYQMSQLILPLWTESGECGRDSVGDGVPTPRFFLLLLRQLEHKNRKSADWQSQHTPFICIPHCIYRLYIECIFLSHLQ